MKLCDVLLPLMRLSPRQSIRLMGYLGAGWGDDPSWKAVQPRYRSYFDRQLQCIMSADLAEWGGRSCYYWGRFFDVTHQAVLRKYLSPGDTYIDIGANVGYQSMYASRLVGHAGTVFSFEPSPATYSVLLGHLGVNRIRNCQTFAMALSDTDGAAVLNQVEEHSGTSTLREQSQAPVHSFSVPMRRGDGVLRDISFTGKAIVKIDVEGFELHVLRGLRETLDRLSAVSVEVSPAWLEQTGGSAEELYRYMREAGFRALIPTLRWKMGLFFPRLELAEVPGPIRDQHDVLFVR